MKNGNTASKEAEPILIERLAGSGSLMLLYQFCKGVRGIPYEKLTLDRIDKRVAEE